MRDEPRLTKNRRTWHTWVYVAGVRKKFSTGCRTRSAALIKARELEAEAADPIRAAAASTTLEDALHEVTQLRREQAKSGARSADTVTFYESKAAVLCTVLGHELALESLRPPGGARVLDAYVSERRRSVVDATIYKELVVLRAALKLAKRRGQFAGDLEAVMPELAAGYVPRKRFVRPEQLNQLLGEMDSDDAARAALMVATSAELRASLLARDEDLALLAPAPTVFLRGTKRASRQRTVHMITAWQRQLAEYALAHARGRDGLLFAGDPDEFRHHLRAAAKRCGLELSANDLRRTYSTWLRGAGASLENIAPGMGHIGTRMLERVYDATTAAQIAGLMALELGLGGSGDTAGAGEAGSGKTRKTRETKAKRKKAGKSATLVPKAGIEPATRGFSGSGRNWRSPRNLKTLQRYTQSAGAQWGQRRAGGRP